MVGLGIPTVWVEVVGEAPIDPARVGSPSAIGGGVPSFVRPKSTEPGPPAEAVSLKEPGIAPVLAFTLARPFSPITEVGLAITADAPANGAKDRT